MTPDDLESLLEDTRSRDLTAVEDLVIADKVDVEDDGLRGFRL